MILLDTHSWVWWINDSDRLTPSLVQYLDSLPADQVFIGAISCWEVAKLVEKGRINLLKPLDEWFNLTIGISGLTVIELEIPIILDACQLPAPFHNGPADQLIVATSRIKGLPLLTVDSKILIYKHVSIFNA